MLRRVNISDWQKVTEQDFNNFGLYPQFTFDAVLEDLGPGFAFSGFNIAQSGPASVILGPGRLYTSTGPVYYMAEGAGAQLDLIGQLPVVARRWAAITVWGQEIETSTEPRTFLTDATTRATVARVVSTETRRHCNYALVYGNEAPDPTRPAIQANVLAVGFVLLSSTGIVSIVANEEARAESIRRLGQRSVELDNWRSRTGTRLDTLTSDLASLAERLGSVAQLDDVIALLRDMAIVKEQLAQLAAVEPATATFTAWSVDHFLTYDFSDRLHTDFMARIEEGIRFPPGAERTAEIALLNQFDNSVTLQNNFVLPRYNETSRLEVIGNDAELSISQYQYQTVTYVQLAKTRMVLRFGTPFWWSSSSDWWEDRDSQGGNVKSFNLTYDPIRQIFIRPSTGETFQILNGAYVDWPGQKKYRLRQYWEDEIIDEYYFDRVVTTEGVNGAIVAQTFLVAQEGWLTSIELFFTRIADTGDVQVMICETSNGAPVFDRVIGRATLTVANLRTYPQASKVNFIPTFLKKDRFAIVLQTAGNHFVSLVADNKYAQGGLFHSSDQAWAMGDLTRDMAMRLNFASFDVTRLAVQLTPLELTGGIAAIDINVDSIRPRACTTTFEVQVAGVWTPFAQYDINPMNNLPPLLPLRVVFGGTTDVMPGIGLGPNSVAYTWRPRGDFCHISSVQDSPAPVNTIYIDAILEQWLGSPAHTCDIRLLTGVGYTTVVAPSVIADQPDSRDPLTINRKCTFLLSPGTISSFKIRITGTTTNVLNCYHVAERVQVSLFTI